MRGTELIECVLAGETPPRTPIYGVITSDAFIEQVSGESLARENAEELTARTYRKYIDLTRFKRFLQGLFIHIAKSKHIARWLIHDNRRDEALFVKMECFQQFLLFFLLGECLGYFLAEYSRGLGAIGGDDFAVNFNCLSGIYGAGGL